MFCLLEVRDSPALMATMEDTMAQRINNQTRNQRTPSANLERVYEVADKLYQAYHADFEDKNLEKGSKERNALYGVLMNTRNAAGKSLQEVMGEDDASHASNLAIQKISGEIQAFANKVVDF